MSKQASSVAKRQRYIIYYFLSRAVERFAALYYVYLCIYILCVGIELYSHSNVIKGCICHTLHAVIVRGLFQYRT